jgi:hypothetical protein
VLLCIKRVLLSKKYASRVFLRGLFTTFFAVISTQLLSHVMMTEVYVGLPVKCPLLL